MSTRAISDASFEADVINASQPVLVDFWAEWCGPCRSIAASLEQLAEEFGDKLSVVKVNVDENPDAPARYGVRGIPTMILFKDGAPVATQLGAAPKSALKQWVGRSL